MEQSEEKKNENIQRKKGRRCESSWLSKSSSYLSLDLTSEIFLRLPVKSAVRFRFVSKLWSSITTNPYFTKSFQSQPNLLVFFKEGDRFFVFTLPQQNLNLNESYSYSSCQPIDSYHITYKNYCSFTIKAESVHGLICFQKAANPIVWNPTMRKFLPLPLRKPETSWKSMRFFLGYDPVEGKHKVVCIPCGQAYDECQVLTLGSDQESWRTVKTNPFTVHRTYCYGKCRCINGVIYYQAFINFVRVIMSFDVRSEKFDVIKLPWDDKPCWPLMMISFEGRLACLGSKGTNSLSMWLLENAEKHEWSTHNLLPLSHYDRDSENFFKLIGMTNDGELIYVPKAVHESFHVIYIDPMRKAFRRVEYRGIGDKDFRQRNGIGDQPMRGLQFYPNHIETLMSL